MVDLPEPDGPTMATHLAVSDGEGHLPHGGNLALVELADGVQPHHAHAGTTTLVASVTPAPVISTRPAANSPVRTAT